MAMTLNQTIAVSTAWNALRHDSAREILGELRALGFTSFELNVHLSEAMLREIEAMMPEIEVITLHNYCPVPDGPRDGGSGDFYSLSSPDPVERRRAVGATLRTAEWARRLGARAVVLHFDRVQMEHRHQEILDLRLAGRHDEADEIICRDLAIREKNKGPYLDAALESAAELAERVGGDVLLGVEARLIHNEIPSCDEMELFLETIPPSAGGYWHDFGHAYILELIGAGTHKGFLARYAGRMIGMHVHDALGKNDHGPLTHRTINFANLLPLVPPDVMSVLEIHSGATAEELVRSRVILASLLAGNRAVGKAV